MKSFEYELNTNAGTVGFSGHRDLASNCAMDSNRSESASALEVKWIDAKSEIDNPQIEYTEIQKSQIEKSKSRRKIIDKWYSESESFDIVLDSMFEIGNSELIDSVKKFIPVQNKSPEIDL